MTSFLANAPRRAGPSFLATPRRRACSGWFVALLLVELALLWWLYYAQGGKALVGDEVRYRQVALDILAGGAWHPSTIWPPLQPLLIAALFKLFGAVLWPLQVLQTLLWIGCAGLLRALWLRVSESRRAANAATSLFLLNPSTAAYAHYLWPEFEHLFLLLLVLLLLSAGVTTLKRTFVAGTGLGVALLAKSLLTGFWPLLLAFFVDTERRRVYWRAVAAFALGALLLTAPALYTGYRELGRPVIADSSVFNFWVGLNDTHRSDYVRDQTGAEFENYMASAAQPAQRDAIYRNIIKQRINEAGIYQTLVAQMSRQYFRLLNAKTLMLSQMPGPACAGYIGAYRSESKWLLGTLELWAHILHIATLVGFALGLCFWRRWRSRLLWVLLFLAAYQLALYLGLHVKARFLLPLLPMFCGFAGSALIAVFPGKARARELSITPFRVTVGAILAALLLFLAYAGPLLDQAC